ncbi:hypothetical protein [Enhygromyxa salina]|uniref:Tetratricopeptide repeat protein n=1 Tax=Enhygromyxa salina TaxID=215803 RepID=A0A2S9YT55_9BACT|nr:hypothetical protein [Enhygromyxa salina]PRQ08250.1 hypothetical protein ENSA7_18720 [Enhygromyxa salina]
MRQPHSTSISILALTLVLAGSGCKKNEPTAAPEDDTWVPDESLEPAATPTAAAPELSEEERLEQAKALYIQAEQKAAAEDWTAAVDLYEQAYFLVPGKHGFAFKVGVAADKAGDCKKATQYLEHFVTYAEADKYGDDLKQANKTLAALKKQGCSD